MSIRLLPDKLLRFARRNGADTSVGGEAVQLTQKGMMRFAPDKPWKSFEANQLISSTSVEFEWAARIKLAPFLWVQVVDSYRKQRGCLTAKLWGVMPLASARGPNIDQGEIQRYLAELPWCPPAFFHNPSLNFKQIDDDRVRVWFSDESTYIELDFDDQGDIIRASTPAREREGVGRQPWLGQFRDYREIGGMRLPLRASVSWETPTGPFEYWQGEIVSLSVLAGKEPT